MVAAVAASVLVFYMNIRHENNLSLVLTRKVQVQEGLIADQRFKDVVVAIDGANGFSTANGTVASRGDLGELMKVISKIRPFSGTSKWVVSVTVTD